MFCIANGILQKIYSTSLFHEVFDDNKYTYSQIRKLYYLVYPSINPQIKQPSMDFLKRRVEEMGLDLSDEQIKFFILPIYYLKYYGRHEIEKSESPFISYKKALNRLEENQTEYSLKTSKGVLKFIDYKRCTCYLVVVFSLSKVDITEVKQKCYEVGNPEAIRKVLKEYSNRFKSVETKVISSDTIDAQESSILRAISNSRTNNMYFFAGDNEEMTIVLLVDIFEGHPSAKPSVEKGSAENVENILKVLNTNVNL